MRPKLSSWRSWKRRAWASVGRVSAQDVLSYDEQGSIEWANEGMREWVTGIVGQSHSFAT